MRALAVAFLLAASVLTPGAAAGLQLDGERVVERALVPGADAALPVSFVAQAEGFLYAKLLPTPGNAVNDGTRPNGSVVEATGWRISFALVRENGTRESLGTFVDSTRTPLVPVAPGERVTLESTLHVPAEAASGGPTQRAYVAVAFRESALPSSGSTSGAAMDASRSLTLVLSNALLPPAAPAEEPAAPPVGPVDESGLPPREVVVRAEIPPWFLVAAALSLVAIVLLLAAQTWLLARHLRAREQERDERAAARRVPVATTEALPAREREAER